MTQAKGAKARTLIDFETTFGSDPASIATTAYKLALNSNSVVASQAVNAPATITGRRDPVEPFRGNHDVGGDLVIPVDATQFGLALKAAFGAPTTTGAEAPYTHVFKVGDSQPSLVIEKGFTDIAQYMKYNGCKVSKLSLSVGGDGELTASVTVMGAKETISTSSVSSSPQELNLDRLGNFQASLKIDDAAIAIATALSLDIDMALDGDTYAIGAAGYRASVNEGIMAVSGSLTAFFEDAVYINKAVNNTTTSMELIITDGTNTLKFKLPEVKFAKNTPSIDGPGGVKQTLNFQAFFKEASEDSVVVATLINSTASY